MRPFWRHSALAAALLPAVLLLASAPALAQEGHGHSQAHEQAPDLGEAAAMPHGEAHPATDAATTAAYGEAMERMHAAMAAMAYTGNADIDFARGMIPHHQAAIDMAVILLENGKDPQIRALAQAIIAAQEHEIAELEAWLAANAAN